MLFEHEADRTSVQHHPRDLASVNAMKQTCVIVILAYVTLFQPSRDTQAVYMLCVVITCRVQVLPAAAAFLLLYPRRIGQIPLLLSHLN